MLLNVVVVGRNNDCVSVSQSQKAKQWFLSIMLVYKIKERPKWDANENSFQISILQFILMDENKP